MIIIIGVGDFIPWKSLASESPVGPTPTMMTSVLIVVCMVSTLGWPHHVNKTILLSTELKNSH